MKRFHTLLKTGLLILASHSLVVYAQPNSHTTSEGFEELDKSQFICVDDSCRNDLRRLHRLSRFGSMDAHTMLGVAYVTGDGLKQDIEHGLGRLRLASKHNHAPAMFVMADWYANGQYVQADPELAQQYLASAVQQEYPPALYRYALLYLGSGEPEQVSKGVTMLEQASDQNLVSAMYLLARLKYVGGLVEYDLVGAANLFRRLSLSGHEQAPTYLREIIAELESTDDEQRLQVLTADSTNEHASAPAELDTYIADLQNALDIERIQVYGQSFNFEIESPLTVFSKRLEYSGLYERGSMMRIRTADCESLGCIVVQPGSHQRSLNEALTGQID